MGELQPVELTILVMPFEATAFLHDASPTTDAKMIHVETIVWRLIERRRATEIVVGIGSPL